MGRTSSSKPTTSENAREALRKLIIYYQFEKHTQINILGRYLRPEVISVKKTKMGLKKQQIYNFRKCNVKVYNLHQIIFSTFACTFLDKPFLFQKRSNGREYPFTIELFLTYFQYKAE